MSGVLELRNVFFDVNEGSKKKRVLSDINLRFSGDKLVVITGPNGSGKSTLAKIIMGIISPTKGKILFDKVDITERAQLGIGYAFQQPVKFKGVCVYDLLKIASNGKLTEAGACEYLNKVGLNGKQYIERKVDHSLSGGELKRIELATVIARQLKLSIFDEPEAGIDLWSFNELVEIFSLLRKASENKIIVAISHHQKFLENADEIVILSDGRVALNGDKDLVLSKMLSDKKLATVSN